MLVGEQCCCSGRADVVQVLSLLNTGLFHKLLQIWNPSYNNDWPFECWLLKLFEELALPCACAGCSAEYRWRTTKANL